MGKEGFEMMFEGSAVSAMAALRGQIEDRLMQTEDYRALKALDKAIAEVEGISATRAPVLPVPLTRPTPAELSIAEQHSHLQQKIAERFNSAVA
jgi:hypothetical protein